MLDADLAQRLRSKARSLGVSAASLVPCGLGLGLSRSSGQKDPVFGTVLFGRMQGGEGADRVLGLFINTLPVRIPLGEMGAERAFCRHIASGGAAASRACLACAGAALQWCTGAGAVVHLVAQLSA